MSPITRGIRPRISDPELKSLWDRWTEVADADGLCDFYSLQTLIMKEVITAGEAFARMRPRYLRDGYPVPLQVQVLPGEFVPTYDASQRSISGVIFGGPGDRQAYRFHRTHPGSLGGGSAGDYVEVGADKVAHVFLPVEAGQVRGEPWLVRSIIRLHELDEYEDAELVKKNFAARLTAFFTKKSEQAGSGMIGEEDDSETDEAPEGQLVNSPKAGTGMVVPEGYDVDIAPRHDSGTEFPVFVKQILREACAGLAPVDLVMDDMQSPERSVQLSLMKYQSLMEHRRRMLIHTFCRKVWRHFVDAAVNSGAWTPPAGSAAADYYAVEWVGEPLKNIRPLQQAQADTERMRNGTLTHAEAVEQYGKSYADHIERLAGEARDRDERGLVLTNDPRYVSDAGVSQSNAFEQGDEDSGSGSAAE